MAGKTVMSFLRAGLSKMLVAGETFNWNLNYKYFPNKKEE